jgi:uncharacterized damage-inducible protein DinB
MYARYLQDKDRKIAALLDALTNEERERNRGSHYKSLSGLFRHTESCIGLLLGIAQSALADGSAAKAVSVPDSKRVPEGALTEAQWGALKAFGAEANQALVSFASALAEPELSARAKWFTGDAVPVSFALHSLIVHQTHHCGQISQILDEMHIDNDYSGISVALLPR